MHDRCCSVSAGSFWDKPVVPMPQVEQQLLSEADVQRLFLRMALGLKLGRFGTVLSWSLDPAKPPFDCGNVRFRPIVGHSASNLSSLAAASPLSISDAQDYRWIAVARPLCLGRGNVF